MAQKKKTMLVKLQNKDKPCIVYNNAPLQIVNNFKYRGTSSFESHVEKMY
jgi:hypothetical protein